jgi:hypothetical protein
MRKASLETLFEALNRSRCRYLVAGGLAVVAHGYLRITADADLILDLDSANAALGVAALESLGYRPVVPVPAHEFADPESRESWIRDKGAQVFSLWSDEHPTLRVDLFLREPLDFPAAAARAYRAEIAPGIEVPFVGLEDLLQMKRAAARPRDFDDIQHLEALR